MRIKNFFYGFVAIASIAVAGFGWQLHVKHVAEEQLASTALVEATVRPKPRPACFPTSCAPTTSPRPMPRPVAVEVDCADEPECGDDLDFHLGPIVDIDQLIQDQFNPILLAIREAR